MTPIRRTSTTSKDKLKPKPTSQDAIPSFIRKTYDILEERKFPEIIDWNPEGTALVIKKPSEFAQKVLPTYFKHNNLTSFVRQLNMYNFHKRRTQNIDHVYYHELFQKGKKHLLKEIRRKNHEQNQDKSHLKLPDTFDPSQGSRDITSLSYENQFLKRLYNDAMAKVALLENQLRDLTSQNQSLWAQMGQSNSSNSELTPAQLPMTFGGVSIPPLKLDIQTSISTASLVKAPYLNLGGSDESAYSTEPSHNSPQQNNENEKGFENSDSSDPTTFDGSLQCYRLPTLTLTPQVSQIQEIRSRNDLKISKQEMSIGQLFEAWNYERETNLINEIKVERPTINVLQGESEGILGKREFEAENDVSFKVPEPTMKRHELSIFNRRSLLSNGIEDKEILRMMMRRDSSINEEGDTNMGFDLMDFKF
jgi:hypothetical protein